MTEDAGCSILDPGFIIYFDFIIPILYLTGALLMIPLIYIFIRAKIKGQFKIKPELFYITLFYFIVQLTTFILYASFARMVCRNITTSTILLSIGQIMYTTQTFLWGLNSQDSCLFKKSYMTKTSLYNSQIIITGFIREYYYILLNCI